MNAPDTPPPAQNIPVASEVACLTPSQIADRLHDSPLQSLTAVRMLVMALEKRLPEEGDARQMLKEMDGLLNEACGDLLRLMKELCAETGQDSAAKS